MTRDPLAELRRRGPFGYAKLQAARTLTRHSQVSRHGAVWVGRGRAHPAKALHTPLVGARVAVVESLAAVQQSSHGAPIGVAEPALPVQFGPFVLDPAARVLLREGTPVRLREKSWGVLTYLAARPFALVTPDQLLDAVWNGAEVSRQCVTNAVREVRQALGDHAHKPRWIETVHGRGFRFLGEVGPASVSPSVPTSATPIFVGRATELTLLHTAFGEAAQGEARLVLVAGEAGLGKTALVEMFAHTRRGHTAHSTTIVRGYTAGQHGRIEPYLPLLEVFGTLTRADRRARTTLRQLAPTWALQIPGVLTAPDRSEVERAVGGTSTTRMLREGVAALAEIARRRPLILLLEDLHWADDATVDFVLALGARAIPARLLVVATYRPSAGASFTAAAAELALRPRVRALHLAPFEEHEVAAYLEARFADATLSRSLTPALVRVSRGHPLILCSATDQFVHDRIVVPEGNRWRLADTVPDFGADRAPPATLAGFVSATLAGAPLHRAVLEAAAVVGPEFTADEVAACLERSPGPLDEVCAALARTGRLIRAAGVAAWPDGTTSPRYSFVHQLYRDVLYDTIPPARRRAYHRAASEILCARFESDLGTVAARVAAHLREVDDPTVAVEFLERAAANAARRFAYRQGIDSLRAALEALDTMSASRTRALGESTLRIQLGALLVLADGYSAPEVGRTYERAWQLAATLGEPRLRLLAGAGLAAYYMTRASYRGAAPIVRAMVSLATSHAPRLRALARCWTGIHCAATGRLRAARAHLEAAARLNTEAGIPQHFDLRRMIASQLGCVLVVLGDPRGGVARAAAAARRSRRQGTAADATHAAILAAEAAVLAGDRRRAEQLAPAALALAQENAFPTFLVMATFYCAWARGDEDALAVMERALAERRKLGDRWQESAMLGWLAAEEIRYQRLAAARQRLAEAFVFVDQSGERYFEAELHRLRGDLALAERGQQARREAAANYRRALVVARQQGAGLWEQRARTSLRRARAVLSRGTQRRSG